LRLRTKPAADYIGVSKSTLEKRRVDGNGPTFSKLGRTVVYDTEDLDAYVAARRQQSTSETP
jgi:predicted DNA-binding transcriptional regulator AlpA